MATDGEKLLAEGATVTLKDGVPRRLVLDMEALVVIEARMGSLSAYQEGLLYGFKGKAVTSILAGLVAGFRHLEGKAAISPARVAELMEYPKLQEYLTALDDAWDADVAPPAANASGEVVPGKDSGVASTSRGRKSTAARPSITGAHTRSSNR